jgi:hypothetical protein
MAGWSNLGPRVGRAGKTEGKKQSGIQFTLCHFSSVILWGPSDRKAASWSTDVATIGLEQTLGLGR